MAGRTVWLVKAGEAPYDWGYEKIFSSEGVALAYMERQKERRKRGRSGCPPYSVDEWEVFDTVEECEQ
jgi:hypothetical protein